MDRLDRTERRIVGVLLEKQLAVPDSYPLSENALLAGCNQQSNRDPQMELVAFQLSGALLALQEKDWVARVEGGGRVPRFRHRVAERLGVGGPALPVLAELLLRGPQAPGALKPRIARMGCVASPAEIETVLRELAALAPPLVEQLPLGPRERDRRWRHLLGAEDEPEPAAAVTGPLANEPPTSAADLARRVAALEEAVAELRRLVADLRSR